MINQVNMIIIELPGTVPKHCSTVGVEQNLLESPVSQPQSILVCNTATVRIWSADTSLAEHYVGDEVGINDQVNENDGDIPGTAPAYCSRGDEARSQLLQDDGESLIASPGQQQEQVEKRRILTQQVKVEQCVRTEAAESFCRDCGSC